MSDLIKVVLVIIAISYLFSCSPIDKYEESLSKIEEQIDDAHFNGEIDQSSAKILALSSSLAYKALVTEELLLKDRASQEKVVARIHQLAEQLRAMEDLDDNSENQQAAETIYKQLEAEIGELAKSLAKWQQKYTRISSLISDPAKHKQELEKSQAVYEQVKPALMAKFDKAITDHPHQSARINEFKNYFINFDRDYETLNALFSTPAGAITAEDYLQYLAIYDKIKIKDNLPVTLVEDYSNKIDELYQSYSKLLRDKKEQHAVQIAAVSWNEYYDYPAEYQRVFPYTIVSAADLAAIKNEVASYSSWGLNYIYQSGLIARVTSGQSNSGWPNDSNMAQIWIEDIDSQYTHVYTILDGAESRTEEQQVSEQTYQKFNNSVGFDIYAKPYGAFADEAIDTTHEFGMANVGNEAYGQWQTDPETGQEIWKWLAIYAIYDNLIDRKITRAKYSTYRNGMSSFVPIKQRESYTSNMSYGISHYKSPLSRSYSHSRHNSLKGAGASFRNKGPGRGK